MKLFALPLVDKHKDLITKHCFKECGKISVGGITALDMPCFLCKQEDCLYEEKRMKVEGDIECMENDNVWIRKLKEAK